MIATADDKWNHRATPFAVQETIYDINLSLSIIFGCLR
jgi:hypothetical protein